MRIVLSLFLIISLATANETPFSHGNLLLQGSPVIGMSTRTDSLYWGGMVVGNYFPSFSTGKFSFQMTIGGGKEWFEMSPGVVLAPIGLLVMKGSDNDIGNFFSGLLMFILSFENPTIHIPVSKRSTISPSLHLLRMRWTPETGTQYGGGLGVAHNLVLGDHFTISLFGEAGLQYSKRPPLNMKAGIRIGGIIP